MSANFLSLPRELRNNIYEQLLVLQEPIACPTQPWLRQFQLRGFTAGLLRANKTVHCEASLIFYAQNRFDFTMCTSKNVSLFLEQIGHNNASYIQYICVEFPKFHHLDLHDVTLDDDSVLILTEIQNYCIKLSTLATSLDSTNAMEVRFDALDNPQIVTEALALVDAHFRAILPLQEIVVEVYKDGPRDYIRSEMKNHGWTVCETERVEERDFGSSFSDDDYDDNDYWYNNDDYGYNNDDYDIDNDSDFWRRAGD